MKLLFFILCTLFLVNSCEYTTRYSQYNTYIYANNVEDIPVLKALVKAYAVDNRYDKISVTSMVSHFEKNGQFSIRYEKEDLSYISTGNIIAKHCISIAFYSSINESKAKKHYLSLKGIIKAKFADKVKFFDGNNRCNNQENPNVTNVK